jgi:hypothetical protein
MAAIAVRQCAPTSDGCGLAWMERIMSKAHNTSKLDAAKLDIRPFADCELNAVTGGTIRSMPTAGLMSSR